VQKHADSEQALRATTMPKMHMEKILEAREVFGEYIRSETDGDGSI
jgi:hypothetical protein